MRLSGIVLPLKRRREQRAAERFGLELPLLVRDVGSGTTRDLSASGLSFHAAQPVEVGRQVELTVDYLLDGHDVPLRCLARVVRCEPDHHGFTVGVHLMTAFIE